jgi:hypothetical protein
VHKRLIVPVLIGVAIVAIAVAFILEGTKGAHLTIEWSLVKPRFGAIGDANSADVVDFRFRNPSDVPFVVSSIDVTAVKPNGETLDGQIVSRADVAQMLQFNRFLGDQYNPVLTIRDRVSPRQTVDRMVAATFPVPLAELQKAKTLRITLHEMDGVDTSTEVPIAK